MIAALIQKDLKLFFRNQLFAVVTALGLVGYVALFHLLPDTIDDSINLGIYFEAPDATTLDEMYADFFPYERYDSAESLISAVDEGDLVAGLTLSAQQVDAITRGAETAIDVWFAPGIPTEVRESYGDIMTVVANAGNPQLRTRLNNLQETEEVLGPDLREPLPVRDLLVPMLLLFILSIETMGVATLITQEVERGTANALLTSPLRLGHFVSAKIIMGVGLALVQLVLLVILVGKIGINPALLLTTLLLGSLMLIGLAFVIAALSRDNMAVLAWSVLFIIVLAIPAIGVVLPGLSTAWAELIPSYYLIDSLHRVLNFGATWGDVSRNLLNLVLVGGASIALGTFVLRRRLQ